MKNRIIVSLLLLFISFTITGCSNKNKILKISDLEKYKNISINDIEEVEVDYITLIGGKFFIRDEDKIKNVYETLGNVELVKISNIRTEDAGMKITIITNEKKESFYFELNNYEYDNNTQYETKKLDILKKILNNYKNSKITLKLQHFDFSLEKNEENEKYENSMVIKSENINITGIKFENIDKGMLNEYQEKYLKVIEYIQKKYPEFDPNKWNIIVNMFAANDGNGIIKFNYQIKDMIDTNKSILLTVSNNVINRISFINMNFETDEDRLIELVNSFKESTIQEKKEFASNEEFLKDEITYSYRYNTDELVYTYQLYFYQQYGDEKEDRVINNEYGTEYIINKNNDIEKL